MNEISIDIETRSGTSLIKSGVYRYVESDQFAILLLAYAINGAPPRVVDLTKDPLPQEVLDCLLSPDWLKVAYNANFERVCINKHFNLTIPPEQWDCTMVRATLLTLPLSLDACSKVLNAPLKDKQGKALIKLFSEKLASPADHPEKWEAFKQYCLQDVVSEQGIRSKVKGFAVPAFERKLWVLDQKLNDLGVQVDLRLVLNALQCGDAYSERLTEQAKELTGLEKPNSHLQLKKWIKGKTGIEVPSFAKGAEPVDTDDETVLEMLEIRNQLNKTSVKKYVAMRHGVCADGRLRGLLQYYGANRTGRWAGRLVQVHNLPRNTMKHLDDARALLRSSDHDLVRLVYGDVNTVLSQLVRTAFVPQDGYLFAISDFSAIEARVVAWLSGEQWRLDVFKTHGKIYEASASMMFGVPIEAVTKGSDLRQKGKIAELALGYQGSVGALERMGGSSMGLSEDQMLELVRAWRRANKRIVKFWYDVDQCVKDVLQDGVSRRCGKVTISKTSGVLFIGLPSGRRLAYLEPKVLDTPSGSKILYKGLDQLTGQWKTLDTYGGKLTENIVQAIARDCLAEALLALDAAGYRIPMHVHDEVVIEVPEATAEQHQHAIDAIMSQPLSWAPGLPLKGDSFLASYYKKD
jgi:DNA polymerase